MSEIVAILLVLLVSVWQKRKNIFSNFSIFAFFCSNIFFFTFSGAWKTTKAFFFCLSLFLLVSRMFLFYPLTWAKFYGLYNDKWNLKVEASCHKYPQLSLISFFYVWFLLIYTRRSSSYIYQKLFPTRVLAFPKSYYFPCLLQKVLVENRFFFIKSFLSF